MRDRIQHGEQTDYRNQAHKHLVEKDNSTVLAMVKGIDDTETILQYWNEANRLDVDRTVWEKIKYRMQAIKED